MTAARPICPIAKVEIIPIAITSDDTDGLDTSSETLLVVLTDAEGRTGIGEADAAPLVAKAFLEMQGGDLNQSAAHLLIGRDPVEIGALHEAIYQATIYSGRRGLGIHALSAVDIALHDLAGQQLGVPAYKLMGGARRARVRPYATIYPGLVRPGRGVPELMAIIEQQFTLARAAGFRATKMEVLFYDHVSDAELADLIREGRRMAGDDMLMALDFGYRWTHWRDAQRLLDRVADSDIHFAEACLQHDDMEGHARLAAAAPMRICGAEFAATRFEVREWIERGRVDVVQPDISRCGGLTEIRRIADLAELHGVEVIPHCWKTGILANAGLHFAAACAAAPMFEFISPLLYPSPLRRDLVSPEPQVIDGWMALPTGAGLGLTLNRDIVDNHRTG